MAADHTIAIFAAELILLLFFGRLLGEGMTRIGQPAIFGQLLAGVLLGPSVFGALMPEWRHVVFPDTPALKSMIDAISQIGILLLLLLTGMETNLALVNRRRRAVISTSLFGIAIPFACGVALAYALPEELIPSTTARLVTALFLGTALSISSVKIVARMSWPRSRRIVPTSRSTMPTILTDETDSAVPRNSAVTSRAVGEGSTLAGMA